MITASVGQGGANLRSEVEASQLLLNDWRGQEGLPLIQVDGLVGPETIGAIFEFQTLNALPQDGRIDPDGPTLKKLEAFCVALYLSTLCADLTSLLDDLNGRLSGVEVPPIPAQSILSVQEMVNELQSVQIEAVAAAGTDVQAPRNQFGFANLPIPVLGAVEAAPVVLVMIFLLLMLLVIVSNPLWQRAARQMMEEVIRRLKAAVQKLSEEIKKIVEVVEDAVKRHPQCAMLCSEQLIQFRQLSQQVIEELTAPVPADPTQKEQHVFRLSNLVKRLQQVLMDLVACFNANGCLI